MTTEEQKQYDETVRKLVEIKLNKAFAESLQPVLDAQKDYISFTEVIGGVEKPLDGNYLNIATQKQLDEAENKINQAIKTIENACFINAQRVLHALIHDKDKPDNLEEWGKNTNKMIAHLMREKVFITLKRLENEICGEKNA